MITKYAVHNIYVEQLWTMCLSNFSSAYGCSCLRCLYRSFSIFFLWRTDVATRLLETVMSIWYIKLLYSIIPSTLLSSTPICLISFFNFFFSRCLFCDSASITIFVMSDLSLWLLCFNGTFTLANVGMMFLLLQCLINSISAWTFTYFVFQFSNVFITLRIPCPCFPVDTGRKLNVHKTFRRCPGRLLNVLCTFNLRSVSMGFFIIRVIYNMPVITALPLMLTFIDFFALRFPW